MNWTTIVENPFIKALGALIKDMIPAGIMDWWFLGKLARRKEDGTRVPNQYEDEKEYRRVAAIVRDRLEREGKDQETLVDEVDTLLAGMTAIEAFTFRECIRLTGDEEQKILIFMDVAKADPGVREAKIKAVTQRPDVMRWVAEEIVASYGRYKVTLLPTVMSPDMADALGVFTRSLKSVEHLQWQIAIGAIQDQGERLAAIQEITDLQQDQRYARARSRGYINASLIRSTEETAQRFLTALGHGVAQGTGAVNDQANKLADQLRARNDETQNRRQNPQPLGWATIEALTGYRRP